MTRKHGALSPIALLFMSGFYGDGTMRLTRSAN
jgi:hypothetical protein